jgi:serine/threonine protein kinase
VDFKRHNVRFDGTSLTVVDFDCAERFDPHQLPTNRVGTAGYRAPEVESSQPSNLRADTWSVGIIFGRELLRLADVMWM